MLSVVFFYVLGFSEQKIKNDPKKREKINSGCDTPAPLKQNTKEPNKQVNQNESFRFDSDLQVYKSMHSYRLPLDVNTS